MTDRSKYNQRGVSAKKEDVYKAIEGLDKGLFPNAFCKVYPDYLLNNENYCTIVHADGAGTKSSLAYLYWKETGDVSVWRGIAQDSLVMNTDDLICAGAVNDFLFCSIINRNKHLIPAEVLKEIIQGTNDFIRKMKSYGISIHYMGGETADLGDVVRTVTVDSTISCRMPRNRVIKNEIQPGDVIVGFASFGQATYESEYNSGIGSNGLTAARHDVLDHSYFNLYPETFDSEMKASLAYSGSKNVNDLFENAPLNVGKLLLSPTRTYAPLMKVLLEKYFDHIHGAIHCSGGGQTKVLHYVKGLHIIKENLFPLPPVFKLIQQESKTGWKEMYQVFNMGHRLELYCDTSVANQLILIAGEFGIEARVIGRCELSEQKQVTIRSVYGEFNYH
ncbi:MAG: phosphoribosylformylglycinamidine cyclo-ligase [Chitinophagales bacterium]|nr:phosphoribosylformylglycinamidine cyclo-ligase [Chitinophagales bacterium]